MEFLETAKQAEAILVASWMSDPYLGSIILSEINPDHCLDPRAKIAMRTMGRMADEQEPIALPSLAMQCKDLSPWLADINQSAGGEPMVKHTLAKWHDAQARCRTIQVCQETLQGVEHVDSAETLLNSHEEQILNIRQGRNSNTSAIPEPREVLHGVVETLEARYRARKSGAILGHSSGFPLIDRITGGFNGDRVYIFGGRPKMGKTSLVRQFILSASRYVPVYAASLEMNRESMWECLLATHGKHSMEKLQSGDIPEGGRNGFKAIHESIDELRKRPIYIDDRIQNAQQLVMNTRRMVKERKVGMLVVDYLQMIEPCNSAEERSPLLRISNASKRLVSIGREHNIPVIALVQLNRDADGVAADDLTMRMIRDCGQIEQDASFIGLLGALEASKDPKKVDAMGNEILRSQETEGGRGVGLKVVANRWGPGGQMIPLFFKGDHLKFYETSGG